MPIFDVDVRFYDLGVDLGSRLAVSAQRVLENEIFWMDVRLAVRDRGE